MRPVNLTPGTVAVARSEHDGAGPSRGMVGGIALASACAVLVGGYLAFARVDSLHSERDRSVSAAAEAQRTTSANQQELAAIGAPTEDSDKQLAAGSEKVLVAAYTQRRDFVMMARELRGIMEGTGGWYESVKTTSAKGEYSVELVGYMSNELLAASFDDRVEATRTLTEAELTDLESVRMQHAVTKRLGRYWKFTITAGIIDIVAPVAGGGSATGDENGTTVSVGGGSLELSLDPEPKQAKPAANVAPKPVNAFQVAATVAGGGA